MFREVEVVVPFKPFRTYLARGVGSADCSTSRHQLSLLATQATPPPHAQLGVGSPREEVSINSEYPEELVHRHVPTKSSKQIDDFHH